MSLIHLSLSLSLCVCVCVCVRACVRAYSLLLPPTLGPPPLPPATLPAASASHDARLESSRGEPRRIIISSSSTSSSTSSTRVAERRAPAALTQPAISLPCAIEACRRVSERPTAPRRLLVGACTNPTQHAQQCSMKRPQKRSQIRAQRRARHAAGGRTSAVRVGGEPRCQSSRGRAAPPRAHSSSRDRDEPWRRPRAPDLAKLVEYRH